MEKKGNIAFVGSIFRDLVAVSERFPKRGETVFGSDFFMGFGGKGANPCVMAARLGANVSLIGKVGNDENGQAYIKHLQQEKVNIGDVGVEENVSTGIATILVESRTGENEIVIVGGANNLLSVQDVIKAEKTIKDSVVLCTVLEIKPQVVLTALKLGRLHGVCTVLNSAPALPDLDPEILENTDILVLNQTEAEIISGISGSWPVTTVKLQELGCKNIVVTLGSEGAVLIQQNQQPLHIPTAKVGEVVDTTGAGDAFVGSLAFLLANFKTLELKQAVEKACKLASFTVGKKGTQSSYPHKHEVEHLL